MTVRPFDWRDLPVLHRAQNESIFLDSALVLTRGALLVPGALFSYLAPAMGVFTSVAEPEDENHPRLIGQIIHIPGAPFAHLTFLAPGSPLQQASVAALTEYLVAIAGERGALRLLADVDEQTDAFYALHQSGFAIYTRQRIWQMAVPLAVRNTKAAWRSARSQDMIAIRVLYNNLVPGLVQQVEPFLAQPPRGLVYYEKDELKAYVEIRHGHRGIWLQPFIHPDTQGIPEHLLSLLQKMPARPSRPVYVCVRSYQSWLEAAIQDLGAQPGSRQAVLVKYLAIQQKAGRAFALPALDGGQAEISAPLARMEHERTYGTIKDYR